MRCASSRGSRVSDDARGPLERVHGAPEFLEPFPVGRVGGQLRRQPRDRLQVFLRFLREHLGELRVDRLLRPAASSETGAGRAGAGRTGAAAEPGILWVAGSGSVKKSETGSTVSVLSAGAVSTPAFRHKASSRVSISSSSVNIASSGGTVLRAQSRRLWQSSSGDGHRGVVR